MHLNVNEVFGPTMQGEGPWSGRVTYFLRLAGCNLKCVWCDTPYSWDWERFDRNKESKRREVQDIVEELRTHALTSNVTRLVITGGEPVLQQKALAELVDRLKPTWEVQVETNGTLEPLHLHAVDMQVVSPKLANSGDDLPHLRLNEVPLKWYASAAAVGKAAFKFVVATRRDLDEVRDLVATHNIPASSVWLMAEGATRAEQQARFPWVADAALSQGWNVSARLHVLAWNDRRAV